MNVKTTDDAADLLDELWSNLEFLFAGGGHHALWFNDPYRGDFFSVFAKVTGIADLSGDEVRDYVREKHLNPETERRDEKLKILYEICNAWDEWDYAWKQFHRFH